MDKPVTGWQAAYIATGVCVLYRTVGVVLEFITTQAWWPL